MSSGHIYNPYNSDDDTHKYYIITKKQKKVYFGAKGYEDFTTHKDEERKQRYINRHKKNEEHLWNKSGIDSPSFWSRFYLWEEPTKRQALAKIKTKMRNWEIL
jgi:hypothetical protein